MPNFLLIEPSRDVSSAVYGQLLRSGNHQVFGFVETEKDGFRLSLNEIIPLIGAFEDVPSCIAIINFAQIDIIIDTYSFTKETTKPSLLDIIARAAKNATHRL